MKKLILIILLFVLCGLVEAQAVTWPLRINVAGRYIEDSGGIPFHITAEAGWELTTQLADADAITYLDDRQTRGFTAIEVRVIGTIFQSYGPNDHYKNAPFTTGVNNWSTPNEAYWARVDTIVAAAKARDMALLMFPAYLGINCGEQGWCANMQAQTNTAMYNYGAWLGTRYGGSGNIIWMLGGDTNCANYTNACDRDQNIKAGILSVQPGAFFAAEPGEGEIAGVSSYTSNPAVDINSVYTYTNAQSRIQTAYTSNSQPVMWQEGAYENDHDGTTIGTQLSQAMITYLGGGYAGHIFGSCPMWSLYGFVYCNSSAAPFDTWQHNLASPGSIGVGNIGKLMRSRKWWTMVPDYANLVVTSAKGSEINYKATARETTGKSVMVWNLTTASVTVDMTKVAGSNAKAWWWNPTDNSASTPGTYATTGTRSFTPASGGLVLVLDDDSLGYAAPGTTTYSESSPTGGQITSGVLTGGVLRW